MLNSLRGYFSIALADGTDIPCLCNLYTLGQWSKKTGLSLTDLEAGLRDQALTAVPELLWLGIETAHNLEGKEVPMSEMKFLAVFGSSEWDEPVKNIGQALNFVEEDGKKKAKRVQKKS